MIGTSLGATVALEHGLQLQQLGPDGSYDKCFSGETRPDLIVGISGCYHRSGFSMGRYTNTDASLLMIAGDSDSECTAEETERTVAELDVAGWDVSYLLLEGANHHTPIFHDVIDGEYVLVAGDPAGEATVQAILDSIAAAES